MIPLKHVLSAQKYVLSEMATETYNNSESSGFPSSLGAPSSSFYLFINMRSFLLGS